MSAPRTALILAALLGFRVWLREQERRRQLAGGQPQRKVKARRVIPILPE